MSDLKGKVALVTGAAGMRGMGRVIALRLAADGAHVVVSDHPDAPKTFAPEAVETGWRGLPSVVEEVEAAGVRGLGLDCDIADSSAVDAMVAAATERFGAIDILINNAAISGPVDVPITALSDEIWHRLLNINLDGPFFASRAVARRMVERGEGGRIVMISSWVAKTGIAGMAGYGAAKAGLLCLTQTLALELARYGIRVNAICPGGFPTDINYPRVAQIAKEENLSIDEARRKHIAFFGSKVPLGRPGDVREISDAVAFLASDQSSYITGQALNVDGGGLMAR